MSSAVRSFRVLVVGVTLLAPNAGPARADDRPKWSTSSTDYYQLLYLPGYEKDANKVKGMLDAGIASLKQEFADFPVDDLLKVKCDVYLHPKGTDQASEGSAVITSGTDEGGQVLREHPPARALGLRPRLPE